MADTTEIRALDRTTLAEYAKSLIPAERPGKGESESLNNQIGRALGETLEYMNLSDIDADTFPYSITEKQVKTIVQATQAELEKNPPDPKQSLQHHVEAILKQKLNTQHTENLKEPAMTAQDNTKLPQWLVQYCETLNQRKPKQSQATHLPEMWKITASLLEAQVTALQAIGEIDQWEKRDEDIFKRTINQALQEVAPGAFETARDDTAKHQLVLSALNLKLKEQYPTFTKFEAAELKKSKKPSTEIKYLRPEDFVAYGEALETEANKPGYVNPLADIKTRLLSAARATKKDARFPLLMTREDLDLTLTSVRTEIEAKRAEKPTPTDDAVRSHATSIFESVITARREKEQSNQLSRALLKEYAQRSGVDLFEYNKTAASEVRHSLFTFLNGVSQSNDNYNKIFARNKVGELTLGQLEDMVAYCEQELVPQEEEIRAKNMQLRTSAYVRAEIRFMDHVNAHPTPPAELTTITPKAKQAPAQSTVITGTATDDALAILSAIKERIKERHPNDTGRQITLSVAVPSQDILEQHFGQASTLQITEDGIDAMLDAIEQEQKLGTSKILDEQHVFREKAPYLAGMKALGAALSIEQGKGFAPFNQDKLKQELLKSHKAAVNQTIANKFPPVLLTVPKEAALAAMDRIYDELGHEEGFNRYNAIIEEEATKAKTAAAPATSVPGTERVTVKYLKDRAKQLKVKRNELTFDNAVQHGVALALGNMTETDIPDDLTQDALPDMIKKFLEPVYDLLTPL